MGLYTDKRVIVGFILSITTLALLGFYTHVKSPIYSDPIFIISQISEGAGLGLYIVHKGAEIKWYHVTSNFRMGAIFSVALPQLTGSQNKINS